MFLPSPNNKDWSSETGSNEAESTETRSSLGEDIEGVPLGLPALLLDIDREEEVTEVEEAETEKKKESYCEKKTPCVELENEEFFEGSSSSWISPSQRTQKPDKNIAVPSQREKKAKRVKNERKTTLDAPISIKPSKTKLTNITKRMTNGLQNTSATKEGATVVGNKSVCIQEGRKQMHSQSKMSLTEQDHNVPVHLQPVPGASQWPSQRKKSNKQKLLEAEPHDDDLANYANTGLGAKNLVHLFQYDYPLSRMPQSKESVLSLSKNVTNQEPSKTKSSRNARKGKSQESITEDDCRELVDMNVHLEDSASFLACSSAEHRSTTVLTAPQKPQKEQLGRKPVRVTRRKKDVRASDQSSEEDGSNRLTEEGGNNSIRKFNKKCRVSSVDSGGNTSHRESSSEPYLEKEKLNRSKKQRTSKTHSLQPPHTLNAKWNNVSGPVSNCKDSTKTGMSFNEASSSDEPELLENSDASPSNSVRHKLIFPTNTPNVRRTKRTRLKPLEFWRGERVDYQTTPSGGFVVSGIISPEQTKPQISKKKRSVKSTAELGNMPDMSKYSIKNISESAVVLDPESNDKIILKCVSSGSSHLYFVNNESLSIYKYLMTPEFSAGKMVLKPLKEKGFQYSYTDTLVFHITQGKLLLILCEQVYLLSSGDYFFIPPGNVYNIQNLLDKECVILFTQLKGDRPEDK